MEYDFLHCAIFHAVFSCRAQPGPVGWKGTSELHLVLSVYELQLILQINCNLVLMEKPKCVINGVTEELCDLQGSVLDMKSSGLLSSFFPSTFF